MPIERAKAASKRAKCTLLHPKPLSRAPIGKPYRTLIGEGGRFSVDNPVAGGRFSVPPGFAWWAFHRRPVGDSLGVFCSGGRFIVDNSMPTRWAIQRAESIKYGYPGTEGDLGPCDG